MHIIEKHRLVSANSVKYLGTFVWYLFD